MGWLLSKGTQNPNKRAKGTTGRPNHQSLASGLASGPGGPAWWRRHAARARSKAALRRGLGFRGFSLHLQLGAFRGCRMYKLGGWGVYTCGRLTSLGWPRNHPKNIPEYEPLKPNKGKYEISKGPKSVEGYLKVRAHRRDAGSRGDQLYSQSEALPLREYQWTTGLGSRGLPFFSGFCHAWSARTTGSL